MPLPGCHRIGRRVGPWRGFSDGDLAQYIPTVLAGLLGGAANFGFLAASLVGLNIDRVAAMFGAVGLGGLPAWRYVLVVGFVPAVLTFFIRLAVKEPERWVKSRARGEASALSELFSPRFRSRTVVAALCATVAVLGTWVYQWVPTWVNAMGGPNAAHNRAAAQFWMAIGAIVGAFFGRLHWELAGATQDVRIFSVPQA